MDDNQITSYKVLTEGGEGEVVEKKSRFIATVREVGSEEEAFAFIEEMKKKYWDARHNCYAFVIGSRGEIARFSDDGEPSGTAGRPMLEVLQGEEIRNIAVVVTRYFGGTLLGTGGLIRAYTQAVKEGLANCKVGVMQKGFEIHIVTDYTDIGKVLRILSQREINPVTSDYGADITLTLFVSAQDAVSLQKELTEATCARAKWEQKKEIDFIDNKSIKR